MIKQSDASDSVSGRWWIVITPNCPTCLPLRCCWLIHTDSSDSDDLRQAIFDGIVARYDHHDWSFCRDWGQAMGRFCSDDRHLFVSDIVVSGSTYTGEPITRHDPKGFTIHLRDRPKETAQSRAVAQPIAMPRPTATAAELTRRVLRND